jgi:hypothetical protein
MATTKNSATGRATLKESAAKKSSAGSSKSKGTKARAASKGSGARVASKAPASSSARRFRVLLRKHEGSSAALLTVPFDVQKVFGTRARVPVRCTINGFAFRSSIFPVGDGTHYMVVNREVREGANVRGGDTVTMTMERDTEPRVITPPAELARALKADKAARAAWDKLSYSHQKEYARAVEEAKRPETRRRRVERAVAALAGRDEPA